MAEETRVGPIGAGVMGKGLGRNLMTAGYALSVADTGSPAFVANAARGVYQLTSMQGYGGDDIVNIGTALRDIAIGGKG